MAVAMLLIGSKSSTIGEGESGADAASEMRNEGV